MAATRINKGGVPLWHAALCSDLEVAGRNFEEIFQHLKKTLERFLALEKIRAILENGPVPCCHTVVWQR